MASREDWVSIAKHAEQEKHYDEVVDAMKKVAKLGVELSVDERNLLYSGYKNQTKAMRASWRILSLMEKNEAAKGNKNLVMEIREGREMVETDLYAICTEIIDLIGVHLLPSSSSVESHVFYLKMKGDFYRYLVEFKTGNDRKEATKQSLKVYQAASSIAEASLSPTHPLRLGLALNYSVFCFESMKSRARACHISKKAFDKAIECRILQGQYFHHKTFGGQPYLVDL